MSVNRGKDFENVIRQSFNKVPNTNVLRLPDPIQGYLGVRNHCDFVVYRYPYEYHIECKSVHGNRLPFSNITDNQWNGLLETSQITGIIAGVICWWVDKDITRFIPIQALQFLKEHGHKSFACGYMEIGDRLEYSCPEIKGRKKRIYFDYDMEDFFSNFNPVETT